MLRQGPQRLSALGRSRTAAPDATSGRAGDALELPRPGVSAGAEHVAPMITTATPAAAPYAMVGRMRPRRPARRQRRARGLKERRRSPASSFGTAPGTAAWSGKKGFYDKAGQS